jgi:hypothetical protein
MTAWMARLSAPYRAGGTRGVNVFVWSPVFGGEPPSAEQQRILKKSPVRHWIFFCKNWRTAPHPLNSRNLSTENVERPVEKWQKKPVSR